MPTSKNDLNTYLKEKNLGVNVLQYICSPLEAITRESITTVSSTEGRRLTGTDKRFQFYNNDGALYADGVEFYDLYQTLLKSQSEGLPQILNDEVPDWDVIMDLIHLAGEQGLTVIGNNQKLVDQWDVVDDHYLNIAMYQARDSEDENAKLIPDQLRPVRDHENKVYLVNDDDQFVLKQNEISGEHPTTDYYQIYAGPNNLLLDDVPVGKLPIVLLCLLEGFTAEQIKIQYLWPKLSADVLATTYLRLEYNNHSNKHIVETKKDLKTIHQLPMNDDKFTNVKYQAYYATGLKLGAPIDENDLSTYFRQVYHNQPLNISDMERKLTNSLVEITDKFNILILRQQRRLLNVSDLDELNISDDDSVGISATPRDNDDNVKPIEAVFTLLEKDSMDLVKRDLTLDQLVSYVWSLTLK
ncbi:hypothetical protein [Companilactobacillus kimchiensis]|uniref:Uncharacterized protein n=1 Tax=Companilactobacillus kimchiensis TaxID=993692 RepID=A0A0R2L4Q0_9LACO|nr:hypothetical protein [Companilactobacillus kimchiensis]KRN96744.1 hypothetical protein IV57_GL001755 [Companilactobacillus kimchiensis]